MANKETLRLRTLAMYRIMDTAADKVFDDLTSVASKVCETPISLISLVDDQRQWFKSRTGLAAAQTPREDAFCAHAIQQNDVMIVEDALQDRRFEHNPLVIGDPNIRFYAGAPLIMANGASLGTLCVIDQVPRQLTQCQQEILATLRDAVVAQLELRRAAQDLADIGHMLPICAWCRDIRTKEDPDQPESWMPLHDYLATITELTHGICPDCKDTIT